MFQIVKNLPAVQETQVQSLGQEDLLTEEMASCSSLLAWETSWTEEPGGLESVGRKERVRTERVHTEPSPHKEHASITLEVSP